MRTIPQTEELIKELSQLLEKHRQVLGSRRVYERVVWLVLAEIVVFARHTVTQMLMSIGWTEGDWSGWYRLFSQERFNYEAASKVMFRESLAHVGEEEVYVVGGDGTQTRRSSKKMEGAHWLHNPQSPVFKRGIHIAQRWFNGSWLMPSEGGTHEQCRCAGCLHLRKSQTPSQLTQPKNGNVRSHFCDGLRSN